MFGDCGSDFHFCLGKEGYVFSYNLGFLEVLSSCIVFLFNLSVLAFVLMFNLVDCGFG